MKSVLGLINLHEQDDLCRELTNHRPLAALPFGGRYRLIDFTLSNMVNSGIHNVGVLMPAKYRSLIDHLRSGKEWDLARKRDGLFLLPPANSRLAGSLYRGDLEHFHVNLDYIRQSAQQHVIITSSHVVISLSYRPAWQFHTERQADITVLYKEEDCYASECFPRATMLTTDADDRVVDMEVNPGKCSSHKICLETFIMSKALLMDIVEDCIAHGTFDFIKDGIIRNLQDFKVYGYPYNHYLAKINSVQSYYDHTMELLNPRIWQELFYQGGPIHTKTKDEAPAKYGAQADVINSLVAGGCVINGKVENSVLFRGVKVGPGATVKNSIIMQKSLIGPEAVLENVICDKEVQITAQKALQGVANYPLVIAKGTVI